jgi:GH24 family phage-related lysozyme (muramidase)
MLKQRLAFTVVLAALSLCITSCVRTYDNKLAPGILLELAERPALPAGETLRPLPGEGLDLTKASEGFVASVYNDAAGYCTVAYGHLIYKRQCDGGEPPEFKAGVSEPRGAELLKGDMIRAQYVVQIELTKDDPSETLFKELTDGQYGALCDFVYNAGGNAFRSSTLLQRIKARQFEDVPTQLRRWVQAGGKPWPGLVKRRQAEIDLFFKGLLQPKGAPSATEPVTPLDIRATESP